MKKKLIIIMIAIILSFSTVVYATNQSYAIKLISSKTQLMQGEEFEVILKIENLKNITEGIYAYSAQIEYDTTIFETLNEESFTGENGWSSPTFNQENGKITADISRGVKTEGNLLKIMFKVKQDALIDKTALIKIINFKASEGEIDIETKEEQLSLLIVNKNQDNDDNNENTSNENNNRIEKDNSIYKTNEIITRNLANLSDSTAKSVLPNAGNLIGTILFVIVLFVIIGVISYIKYKKVY